MGHVHIGMIVYHKTNGIAGIVEDIIGDEIIVRFDKPVISKKVFRLTVKSFGEHIFFNKKDIELGFKELCIRKEYLQYGNSSLLEAIKREDEQKQFLLTISAEELVHQNRMKNPKLDLYINRRKLYTLSIQNELKKRNITQLLHFTQLENMPSILKLGLVPVSFHDDFKIISQKNDCLREDKDFTSLSVEFPNYRMFYAKRKENAEKQWAVLALNPAIIFSPDNYSLYCTTNARSVDNNRGDTDEAFRMMFTENHPKCPVTRHEQNIPSNYTTDPQAEILVYGAIHPKYISYVYFKDSVTRQTLLSTDAYDDLKDISSVNMAIFSPRCDWHHWQKESEEYYG